MTDQPPTRIPYCHKIRYGITGAPTLTEDEMDGTFAPGVGVRPTLIELVYLSARDGKSARIDASVTGDWMRFGRPDPDGFGGQVTTHFKSGPDGWPVWLAEEARQHDPTAETKRLRTELERRTEDVAFLERATLPDLRRQIEHHKDGKQRWRGRAEKAEAMLERVCRIASRLAAHAVGFGDVLDESDHGPWGRTVGADIAELAAAVAPDAASEATSAPLSPSQPSSVSRVRAEPYGSGYGGTEALGGPQPQLRAHGDRPRRTRQGLHRPGMGRRPDRLPRGLLLRLAPAGALPAHEARAPARTSPRDVRHPMPQLGPEADHAAAEAPRAHHLTADRSPRRQRGATGPDHHPTELRNAVDRIYTNHRHNERRIHIEINEAELADLLEDFQDIGEDDNAYDATKKLIEILRAADTVFAEDRKRDAHEAETSRT